MRIDSKQQVVVVSWGIVYGHATWNTRALEHTLRTWLVQGNVLLP